MFYGETSGLRNPLNSIVFFFYNFDVLLFNILTK